MQSVIITGASSGIGRAAAEYLAQQNWTVFAGVRKDEDADLLRTQSKLIHPLILDVTKGDSVADAIEEVKTVLDGKTLNGLVNNAGIAQMGPLAHQPLDEFRAHFDVNTFGLLQMTQAALPLLGMDDFRDGPKGRIVNITSVGGELAAPFLGAYCATKHAVESMTDTLRRELLVYGIDAIAIGPGSVKTPIWGKAEEKNTDTPYAKTAWGLSIEIFAEVMMYGGRNGLEPEVVARTVEEALTAKKPKARYAPVPDKFNNWYLPRLMPKRIVDKAMAKRYAIETA